MNAGIFPGVDTIHHFDIIKTLFDNITTNSDPIDFVDTSVDGYVILCYLSSQNAASWKSATNAVYTVPTGKIVIPILLMPSSMMYNNTGRRMRLYNSTDSTDFIPYTTFCNTTTRPAATSMFVWEGDSTTPSAFISVGAGKKLVMEIWNTDTTKRAMGGACVLKLLSA